MERSAQALGGKRGGDTAEQAERKKAGGLSESPKGAVKCSDELFGLAQNIKDGITV